MKRAERIKPFFEWFKESDKFFADNNIPLILAVLADGIDHYPEWVEYVKNNLYRYEIALHGHTHMSYLKLDRNQGYEKLARAKEKIENTLGVEVKRWIVPFGKRALPEWGQEVSKKLNVNFHTKNNPFPHFYFHYWKQDSVERIKTIWQDYLAYDMFFLMKKYQIKNPYVKQYPTTVRELA